MVTRQKRWYIANMDRRIAEMHTYYQQNKTSVLAQQRAYKKKNRKAITLQEKLRIPIAEARRMLADVGSKQLGNDA